NIAADRVLLNKRLKKEAPSWTQEMTQAVKRIKKQVRELPVMSLPGPGKRLLNVTPANNFGELFSKRKAEDDKEK
ncbi:hypothetical protein KI387_000570, partial [Taxus chinensis]